MFNIEKAKDFPKIRERTLWPWSDMDVGDLVRIKGRDTALMAQKSCHPYGRHNGKKFRTKTIDGVLHVWRVE